MPVCVQPGLIPIDGGGMVEVLMPAESGPGCGFVVFSTEEAATLQASAANNVFALSVEDGVLLSGAVATLWAIAWAIKSVRRAL